MVVQTIRKHAPSTGHKDNHHGVPTYWSKSGHTLQKYITALATCDFLLFGFDVCATTSCDKKNPRSRNGNLLTLDFFFNSKV